MNIIIALLVFGVIVMVHELGHFSVAKYFKVKIHEFAIGMGPKIFKKRVGETDYTIRALPLGGFVQMEGEDEASDDENGFNSKPPLQRMAIIFAGPFMNFIFTIVVFTMIFITMGIAVPTVDKLIDNKPAQLAGLQVGDKISEINGEKIDSWDETTNIISSSIGKELNFKIDRKGEILDIKITPENTEGRGTIGFYPKSEKNFFKALTYGTQKTWNMLGQMIISLKDLVTGKNVGDVVGPVGIINIVGDAANNGVLPVVYLAAIISLNLGLINLLPIPALDGSRMVFQFIELVTGKKVPAEKEGMVHIVGFVALMSLMLILTYKDILRIWFKN